MSQTSDAALWILPLLSQSCNTTRDHHRAYLPWHYSLCVLSADRIGHCCLFPPAGHMASQCGFFEIGLEMEIEFPTATVNPSKQGGFSWKDAIF